MSASVAEATTSVQSATVWRQYPTIYEINTWVWLSDLRKKYERPLDLSSVPSAEWDAIAACGFDAVWLMGVWERSPAGTSISNSNLNLQEAFRKLLPDFHLADNVGSPYCVRRYVVDSHLGGRHGLADARCELSKRGMNLILDFVPNHVAPDHPWVSQSPEYFVHGDASNLTEYPQSYREVEGTIFACGRDPYFPPWSDVLQLNAFQPDLRKAVIKTLAGIADQCDGVRCDMAMLVLNSTFATTWTGSVGMAPSTEYWSEVIPVIKKLHPGFLFIAEAYWGLEWALLQQGFDFCYDKTLYDHLEHSTPEEVRLHLSADLTYQSKLLRFIENHDEPRAATTFPSEKERAVATTIATLPGAKLFHEGQFEGRKLRLPVFLARRPVEHFNRELYCFYTTLLETLNERVFHNGRWTLCQPTGWPDNTSYRNLLVSTWALNEDRYLIVVNLSNVPSQGLVHIPWQDLGDRTWQLIDRLSNTLYSCNGDDILSSGLYVALTPWGYHFFRFVHTNNRNNELPTDHPATINLGDRTANCRD